MELATAKKILIAWCHAKPQIRKLWIFGSRVTGVATQHSDFDIAIELVHELDWEVELVDLWEKYDEPWSDELTKLLPWKIDLEFFDPDGTTPCLTKYLDASGLMLYESDS